MTPADDQTNGEPAPTSATELSSEVEDPNAKTSTSEGTVRSSPSDDSEFEDEPVTSSSVPPQSSSSSAPVPRPRGSRLSGIRAFRRRRGGRDVESEGDDSSASEEAATESGDDSDESDEEEDGDSEEGEPSDESDEEVRMPQKQVTPLTENGAPGSDAKANISKIHEAATTVLSTATEPQKWAEVMEKEDEKKASVAITVSSARSGPEQVRLSKRAWKRQQARERAAAESPASAAAPLSSPSTKSKTAAVPSNRSSSSTNAGRVLSRQPAANAQSQPPKRTLYNPPPTGPRASSAKSSAQAPSSGGFGRGVSRAPRGRGNSNVKGSGMARRGLMSWGSDDDILEGGVEETPNLPIASVAAPPLLERLPPSAPRALRKAEAEARSAGEISASSPVPSSPKAEPPSRKGPDEATKWGHEGFQELLAAGERKSRGRASRGRGAPRKIEPSTGHIPTAPRAVISQQINGSAAHVNPRDATQALVSQDSGEGTARVRVPLGPRTSSAPNSGSHSPAPSGGIMTPAAAPSPVPYGLSLHAPPAVRALPPGFMMDATGYVYDCTSGTPVAVGFVPPSVPPHPDQGGPSGTTFYFQPSWAQQGNISAPYLPPPFEGGPRGASLQARPPGAIPSNAVRAAAFQPVKKTNTTLRSSASPSSVTTSLQQQHQQPDVSPTSGRLKYGDRVQMMRQQQGNGASQGGQEVRSGGGPDAQSAFQYQGSTSQRATHFGAPRNGRFEPLHVNEGAAMYSPYVPTDDGAYYASYGDPQQYASFNPYAPQAHQYAYGGVGQQGPPSSALGMFPGGYGPEQMLPEQQQAYLRNWSREQEAQAQSYQLAAQGHMGVAERS